MQNDLDKTLLLGACNDENTLYKSGEMLTSII